MHDTEARCQYTARTLMCILHMSNGALFARELLRDSKECDPFIRDLARMREAYARSLGAGAVARILAYKETRQDAVIASWEAYGIKHEVFAMMHALQRWAFPFHRCHWSFDGFGDTGPM